MNLIDVAVPLRVFKTFHYLVDETALGDLQQGSLVEVPFRSKDIAGFVLGFPQSSDIPKNRIKHVSRIIQPRPLFTPSMYRFLQWVSDYYFHPIGEVLATAIPKYCWKHSLPTDEELLKAYEDDCAQPEITGATFALSEEQEFAIARILDPSSSKPILLHGVTGSGKTEVYIKIMEQTLLTGKSVIVLVPEISLTPQLLNRFSARFPQKTAVLHSHLTNKQRFFEWERIQRGQARIIIGARSAIFAPVKELGLIVVDEEHETSFKQEDSLRYHARDLAVVRAHMENAKIILGSATPSLESYANVQKEKYDLVTLKKRVEDRPLPKSIFVDLKNPSESYSTDMPWLSRTLIKKISEVLEKKQQALLYLNRLGYAHFLFCKDCGHTWRCSDCDISLTFYQRPPRLKCHYCGKSKPPPPCCDECQGTSLEAMGLGTEQVEQAVKGLFPKAIIERMDRGVIRTKQDLESLLTRIHLKEVDILIGTQMMAKGHDFPGISLVGILVADASLNIPDFRSNERTFQVITQVAGRAGRADIPGEVVIQTVQQDHPILQMASQNRSYDFYKQELSARSHFGFPPSKRLALLKFQHKNAATVARFANAMTDHLRKDLKTRSIECQFVGPSEAPIAKVKQLFRWQCLIKSDSVTALRKCLELAQQYFEKVKSPVQFAMDVDPLHLN